MLGGRQERIKNNANHRALSPEDRGLPSPSWSMAKTPQADISSNLTPRQNAGMSDDDDEITEAYRVGGFVPTKGGTPIFELHGEMVSEFLFEEVGPMYMLAGELIAEECWFMVIPPHYDSDHWTVLVEWDDAVEWVADFLALRAGFFLSRGLHTEAWDDIQDDPEGPANDA